MVAETFAAAVAINALLDRPIVSLALSTLGFALLVGWIKVTHHRIQAVEYWREKLKAISPDHSKFYDTDEEDARPRARRWFGGTTAGRKVRIGILQWIFIVTWIVSDFVSIWLILKQAGIL